MVRCRACLVAEGILPGRFAFRKLPVLHVEPIGSREILQARASRIWVARRSSHGSRPRPMFPSDTDYQTTGEEPCFPGPPIAANHGAGPGNNGDQYADLNIGYPASTSLHKGARRQAKPSHGSIRAWLFKRRTRTFHAPSRLIAQKTSVRRAALHSVHAPFTPGRPQTPISTPPPLSRTPPSRYLQTR